MKVSISAVFIARPSGQHQRSGFDGWRIRRRGFRVRHRPVDFLNMPLGVGYAAATPFRGVVGLGFVGFVARCSWGVVIFQA